MKSNQSPVTEIRWQSLDGVMVLNVHRISSEQPPHRLFHLFITQTLNLRIPPQQQDGVNELRFFSLVLLSHAANLLIFTVGCLTSGVPAFVPFESTQLTNRFADSLPQTLILTAIVIGFGVQAFALVLLKRV